LVERLLRNIQPRNYYALIRLCGKLIWKSFKPDSISVVWLRLGILHKQEPKLKTKANAAK
jgi:hypothetical protein